LESFFDIKNGVRKNFLNLNFADFGPKEGFYPCLPMFTQEFVRKNPRPLANIFGKK
jgi:hypothetical protein